MARVMMKVAIFGTLIITSGCASPVRARVTSWSGTQKDCTVSVVVSNQTSDVVRARVEITVSAVIKGSKSERNVETLATEVTTVEVAAESEAAITRQIALPGLIKPTLVRVRIL